MGWVQKAWQWLSGKKTAIAALYWVTYLDVLPVFFDGDIPDTIEKWLVAIGKYLVYFGLGHKVMKVLQKTGGTK